MTKAELRSQFLQQRKALTPDGVHQRSQLIVRRFFDFLESTGFAQLPLTIHLFLPIQQQKEVDTWLIIRRIWAEYDHLNVIVPVMNVLKHTLSHYRLFPETLLIENRWGIPEPTGANQQLQQPTDFNIVLVPLLAFDQQGQRVGYGGGFYDRFLAECRTECLKIGLSLFESVEHIDDVEPKDVRLDMCITHGQTYFF